MSAATDKMNDLQAIALGQTGSRPLVAGNDVSVQFDGDAIPFHPQLVHEPSKSKRRGKIAGIAIDVQFHYA